MPLAEFNKYISPSSEHFLLNPENSQTEKESGTCIRKIALSVVESDSCNQVRIEIEADQDSYVELREKDGFTIELLNRYDRNFLSLATKWNLSLVLEPLEIDLQSISLHKALAAHKADRPLIFSIPSHNFSSGTYRLLLQLCVSEFYFKSQTYPVFAFADLGIVCVK